MTTLPVTIDSLPNEILAKIHEEATISYASFLIPCSRTYQKTLDFYTLSSISRVCRRWRQTCLANGPLWAAAFDLNRQSLPGVKEAFRRAKDSPIVLNCSQYLDKCTPNTLPHDFTSDTWQYVFENSHRWGTFALFTYLYSDSVLAENLTQRSPALETFALVDLKNVKQRLLNGHWRNDAFILPDYLLGGDAPHLKTFFSVFVHFSPTFDFSIWENLTCLNIVHTDSYYDQDHIMPDWLGILRSMVLLEHLELTGIFGFFPGSTYVIPDYANVSDVHLDQLSVLKLRTICNVSWNDNVIFDIFVKLIVPSTCKIFIEVALDRDYEIPWSAQSKFIFAYNRHCKALDAAFPDRPMRVKHFDPEDYPYHTALNHCAQKVWFSEKENDFDHATPNFEFAVQVLKNDRSHDVLNTNTNADTNMNTNTNTMNMDTNTNTNMNANTNMNTTALHSNPLLSIPSYFRRRISRLRNRISRRRGQGRRRTLTSFLSHNLPNVLSKTFRSFSRQ